MLTWALADDLRDEAITANAVNPGYVLTPLTTNVPAPLKVFVALTRFSAHTAIDGADTAIWAAASPDVEGMTGRFWNKRREVRCRFRDAPKLRELGALADQQLAEAASHASSGDDTSAPSAASCAISSRPTGPSRTRPPAIFTGGSWCVRPDAELLAGLSPVQRTAQRDPGRVALVARRDAARLSR